MTSTDFDRCVQMIKEFICDFKINGKSKKDLESLVLDKKTLQAFLLTDLGACYSANKKKCPVKQEFDEEEYLKKAKEEYLKNRCATYYFVAQHPGTKENTIEYDDTALTHAVFCMLWGDISPKIEDFSNYYRGDTICSAKKTFNKMKRTRDATSEETAQPSKDAIEQFIGGVSLAKNEQRKSYSHYCIANFIPFPYPLINRSRAVTLELEDYFDRFCKKVENYYESGEYRSAKRDEKMVYFQDEQNMKYFLFPRDLEKKKNGIKIKDLSKVEKLVDYFDSFGCYASWLSRNYLTEPFEAARNKTIEEYGDDTGKDVIFYPDQESFDKGDVSVEAAAHSYIAASNAFWEKRAEIMAAAILEKLATHEESKKLPQPSE